MDGRQKDPGGASCAFQVESYCGMSHCVEALHGSCLANMIISIGRKQYIVVTRVTKERRSKTGL